MRWRAIQDAAFVDTSGEERIWSETNVSEDFDMALRLMMKGYIIRSVEYPHASTSLLTNCVAVQLGDIFQRRVQGGCVA